MNTSDITELLHQREPYLMVSEITECDQKKIKAKKIFSGEEFFLKGHFPDAPVVPGAMIQEFCTQSAGILISKYHSPVENYNSKSTKGHALGVLRKVNYAKFISIVKPTDFIECEVELEEKIENLFHFKARVIQNSQVMAKIGFTLTNISDDHLM